MKKILSAVMGLTALTGVASAAPIDSYNADTLSTGSLSSWTDLSGSQNGNTINALNDPTVAGSTLGSTFNGHQFVSFSANSGLITSSGLFSGSQDRTVVAVYTTPDPVNNTVNPVVGQAGPTIQGSWFVLQSRNLGPSGNPYLAGYIDDASGNTSPNTLLTFAVATYSNSGSLESVYWAYGLNGAVSSASNSTTLNTNNVGFTFGYDNQEPSQGNMQIGLVQVYNSALSGASADALIANLQSYYSAPLEVPEPSTWAMMLGGVAVLGFCVRRKGDKFRV
jgi:hypothetical protein